MAKDIKKEMSDDEKIIKSINLSEELDKARPYIDKFTRAKTFNSERQDAYAENMAFYQGNQHLLKKYKSVCIQTNH